MSREHLEKEHPTERPLTEASRKAYWRANLRMMVMLLAVWFFISYGCGILFVDQLNNFRFAGYKLGFWFAQQGSMYGFVILIFFYAWYMKKLDRQFNVND